MQCGKAFEWRKCVCRSRIIDCVDADTNVLASYGYSKLAIARTISVKSADIHAYALFKVCREDFVKDKIGRTRGVQVQDGELGALLVREIAEEQ